MRSFTLHCHNFCVCHENNLSKYIFHQQEFLQNNKGIKNFFKLKVMMIQIFSQLKMMLLWFIMQTETLGVNLTHLWQYKAEFLISQSQSHATAHNFPEIAQSMRNLKKYVFQPNFKEFLGMFYTSYVSFCVIYYFFLAKFF